MGDSKNAGMLDPKANEGHFGFAFNDVDFSDRVLHVEIMKDYLDSMADYGNRKRKRENLKMENGDETSESSDSDCSVVGEVKTYYISSPILAAKSPFFYKLFKNGMRESQERVATLRINASEESALIDLMKYMYTNTLSATTTSDLLGVVMVADKFEVTSCMSHCIKLLLKKPISLESALLYLELPSSVQPLIDAATKYLTVHFKDFTKYEELAMTLPLSALEVVLGSVGLQVDSEDDLFSFILKWARTHYPELEERREILAKRLVRFIGFPYMRCFRLKKILVYPEFENQALSKLIVEALISKIQAPYGKHIRASKDVTSSNYGCLERMYKNRLINVVQLETPRPHCFVFFDIKKGDCANLFLSRRLSSQSFRLGGRRFTLSAQCYKEQQTSEYHFGLFLKISTGSAACNLDCEFSVMMKKSEDFKSMYQAVDCSIIEGISLGKRNLFGISWKTLMADDSKYFVNRVLHLRAELIIKKS